MGSGRLENAVGEQNAPDIKRAIEAGRTETWVVTTRPNGSTEIQVLDGFGNPKPVTVDASKILSAGNNLNGAKP